jgi:hypothetical protein
MLINWVVAEYCSGTTASVQDKYIQARRCALHFYFRSKSSVPAKQSYRLGIPYLCEKPLNLLWWKKRQHDARPTEVFLIQKKLYSF